MIRTPRATAAFLSFALMFGGVPARAAEIARVVTAGSAAPIPAFAAPLAMPSAAAILPLSAAVPAPSLPSALTAAPALPTAVPALAAAAAAPVAPVPSLARAAAAIPAAAAVLRAVSAPEIAPAAGRAFDGSLTAASDGVEPPPAASGAAAAPRLGPAGLPAKTKRPGSIAGRFLRAAALGAGAAALVPALWSALPTSGALILFAVAALPVMAAGVLLLGFRAARAVYRLAARSAPRANAPPSRRAAVAARALGAALGIALVVATASYERPILERAYAAMDARQPADQREVRTPASAYFGSETARVLEKTADGRAALDRLRGEDGAPRLPPFVVVETRQAAVPLPGTFFADSTVKVLSANPVGREILDGLRDRGGVVRMPVFFISYQEGSAARYTPPDVVLLSVETIEEGGVTVAEFLRSPGAQLEYLRRNQAIIAHELKHADQARRSPFNRDAWTLLRTDGSRFVAAVRAYAAGEPAPSVSGPASAFASAPAEATSGASGTPIHIDGDEIIRSGMTVGKFLGDRAAQRDYIVRHQADLARALRALPAAASEKSLGPVPPSGAPSRAPSAAAKESASPRPEFRVQFGMVQDWEYEAYLAGHFYTHERLLADASAVIDGRELAEYVGQLGRFDDFLRNVDRSEIYAANFRGGSAYDARFLADARARWDVHRVVARVLLARRALEFGNLFEARIQLAEARKVAKENGLPLPVLDIPAR